MKKLMLLALPAAILSACGDGEQTPRGKFTSLANEQCMTYYKANNAGDYKDYCACLSDALAEQFTEEEMTQIASGNFNLREKEINPEFAIKCAPKMPGVNGAVQK